MKKRHTAEQIVGILRQADVFLGKGAKVPEVCKQLGISEQTYYRWRTKYGGMDPQMARQLAAAVRISSASEGLSRGGLTMKWLFGLATTLVTVLTWAADDDKKYQPVDLLPYTNHNRGDSFGVDEANNLGKLPAGEQKFGGILLKIDHAIIQLGSSVLETMPATVEG